jgi:transmembrane sensor
MAASQNIDFKILIKGFLEESLTADELTAFMDLAARPENALLLQQSFENIVHEPPKDLTDKTQSGEALKRLNIKIDSSTKTNERHTGFPMRWVAASIIVLLVSGAFYLINLRHNLQDQKSLTTGLDQPKWLSPDHIGATLFLANGEIRALNDSNKGVIASQGSMQVIQSSGGIAYRGRTDEQVFNEVRTGKGKLWQLVLPDSSKVWLNGNSNIKYPLTFDKDHRTVEASGEIFFEVTHDSTRPFRVLCGGQVMEDIGTSFNIKVSPDGNTIVTTLITGSVKLKINDQSAILRPGEQTTVLPGKNVIQVQKNANLAEALAWKNGYFYFQNANVQMVMKQLSEWYEIEVRYDGPISEELFNGQIEKSLSLSQVLQGLQQTHVHFTLENQNRITVKIK